MGDDMKRGLSRRALLKTAMTAAFAAGLGLPGSAANAAAGSVATLIDLSRCDGCPDRDIPACVQACREKNSGNVPEPIRPIPEVFPRGGIEDFSDKKHLTTRLTPYNYLFIHKAEVEHGGKRWTLSIPRRCMHCDNPACATLCPFAANHKHRTGAVVIDSEICFGGAKCRTVCPWSIPQRQSGVGVYLHIAPTLAGNGAMFKCDLCHDRLLKGENPVCADACPRDAMLVGSRSEISAEARKRAAEMGGFLYGMEENGGTATVYVSPVPFTKIDAALEKGPGRPHMAPVQRRMAGADSWGKSVLLAPVVGLTAGILAVAGALKEPAVGREEEDRKK
ncbi:MAG TPA: 4Fe-4S dicluster domain-containing protein [Deltaproteobacteria bacterium]|nr:4Fe-4S dicluster domain-containing protein [Deltaproteobacteria bacterium]